MTRFGITNWGAMTYQQFIDVGKSLEIDLITKYWILDQTPYYANPINEETSVILDAIITQISQARIGEAMGEIRVFIKGMYPKNHEGLEEMLIR